ncbi:MAG: hypothetical protein EOM12_07905 [Verrucomicrobiae bacterium]|nr:hypothetical protein [Verrucomicrobiae bacterium]
MAEPYKIKKYGGQANGQTIDQGTAASIYQNKQSEDGRRCATSTCFPTDYDTKGKPSPALID